MFELQPHIHTASYQRLLSRIYAAMIAIVTATYLRNGHYHVEEIQKVLDAQQHLRLHWTGLQGQVNRENYSHTSAFCSTFSQPQTQFSLLSCWLSKWWLRGCCVYCDVRCSWLLYLSSVCLVWIWWRWGLPPRDFSPSLSRQPATLPSPFPSPSLLLLLPWTAHLPSPLPAIQVSQVKDLWKSVWESLWVGNCALCIASVLIKGVWCIFYWYRRIETLTATSLCHSTVN